MAATSLREAYDCVVIGNGRTAAHVAAAIARSGKQTLRLSSAASSRSAWLHPRWTSAAGDDSERTMLSGLCVLNSAGQRMTMLRAAATAAPCRASTAEAFVLPAGCAVVCDDPREVRLNGALPPTTIRAGLVISAASSFVPDNQIAIGGIYRDVSCELGEERQAQLYATQRAGEVFWLVPQADGRWSLGLLTSRAEIIAESLADTLEEALVACPALTQRLIAAELLGGLHLSPAMTSAATTKLPGALSVPEYDSWLDPIFACSDWLGMELAGQLALHLPSGAATGAEQLAAWQQDWFATEQLTRERITPWYRLHDDLPAALHDHAQRTWYERLLAGQRATR